MARFVERKVERVDLGNGDWVDLLTRLKYGDRAAIEEKLLSIAADDRGQPTLPNAIQMRLGNLELLMRTIVAWGGPGFCQQLDHPHEGGCTSRPITYDNIDLLDETADQILLELQKRIVVRTPDFTKPSSPPSSTAGEAEASSSDADTKSLPSSTEPAGPTTS